MLIRHDPHLSRGRILMPVPLREWMPPSISLPKDQLGNDVVRTRFKLTARLHDGHVVWRGWFDDRDDADAFLFAMVSGSLGYERQLWDLPTPAWRPDMGENLSYEFATVTFLTATSSSTYTKPSDWNNADNTVECIGAGGSGGVGNRATNVNVIGTGGGGGGYGIYTNLTLSGNATYQCGTGGVAVTRTTAGATNGNAGTETWFNGASYAAASVGGSFGSAGTAQSSGSGATTVNGGAGGAGKGTGSYSGGRGGNATVASGTARRSSGGGGAAGLNGAGNQGVDSSANTGNGGSGDAGSGGAAGVAPGGTGGNGTEWSASYGSGGGGASADSTSSTTAGSGGNYGGGGGGCCGGASSGPAATSLTSGAGIQGLIVVTYATVSGSFLFNSNRFQHILVR